MSLCTQIQHIEKSRNDWIRQQPDWVQLQVLRNMMTHRELLSERQKQASMVVKNNRKLLLLEEYKELKVPIDREKITWGESDKLLLEERSYG